MNFSASNITTKIASVSSHKHILTICQLVSTPLGTILSGTLLLILLTHRPLHTPFSVYVGVILFCNASYAAAEFLLVLLETFGHYSLSLCYLQQYSQWVLCPQWVNAQLQICLNRIWALSFPIVYKQRHTKKMAGLIILTNWIILWALAIPTVAFNVRYIPENAAKPFVTCIVSMSALGRYTVAHMILVLTVPTILVIGTYPFLFYLQLRRSRKRKSMSAENPGLTALIKEDLHAFLVLTSVTVSVTLFWLPVSGVFTTAVTGYLRLDPVTLQLVSYGCSLADVIANPLLIFLSVRDLRGTTLKFFRASIKVPEVRHRSQVTAS